MLYILLLCVVNITKKNTNYSFKKQFWFISENNEDGPDWKNNTNLAYNFPRDYRLSPSLTPL